MSQLISFDNQLVLHDEVLNRIKNLPPPFYPINIFGLARSGKSYFLNMILTKYGFPGNFEVGNNVEAMTDGLWIGSLQLDDHQGTVLLIDTEGTDRANVRRDVMISSLSMLLGSVCLFNYRTILDNRSMDLLNLLSEVSNSLGTVERPRHFSFLARDMELGFNVQGRMYERQNSTQYIRDFLRSSHGDGYDQSREIILNTFPEVSMTVICSPDHHELVENYVQIPHDDFKIELTNSIDSILDIAIRYPKRINGTNMNGEVLSLYISTLVSMVNSNTVINNDLLSNEIARNLVNQAIAQSQNATNVTASVNAQRNLNVSNYSRVQVQNTRNQLNATRSQVNNMRVEILNAVNNFQNAHQRVDEWMQTLLQIITQVDTRCATRLEAIVQAETSARLAEEKKKADEIKAQQQRETERQRQLESQKKVIESTPVPVSHNHGYCCFKSDSMVKLKSGETIQVREVQYGDHVASINNEGDLIFSEVYFVDGREEKTPMQYVYTSDYWISVTKDHLLYTSKTTNFSDISTSTSELIIPGDYIWAYHKDHLSPFKVTDNIERYAQGRYQILVKNHKLLVDNILASAYEIDQSWGIADTAIMRRLYTISPSFVNSSQNKWFCEKYDLLFESAAKSIRSIYRMRRQTNMQMLFLFLFIFTIWTVYQ